MTSSGDALSSALADTTSSMAVTSDDGVAALRGLEATLERAERNIDRLEWEVDRKLADAANASTEGDDVGGQHAGKVQSISPSISSSPT
jgi:hypothetical protein